MYKNKLFSFLREFDRKEMTRFKEFSISPYHLKHDDTRALIAFCSKIFPNFNEKNCDRRRVFQKLYPNVLHDQKQLAFVFTYAIRILEEFLTIEQMNEEKNLKSLILLKKLRLLEKDRFYFQLYERFNKQLEDVSYRDVDHYKFKFLLSDEVNSHKGSRDYKGEMLLQVKQDSLDLYFMAEKLKDVCEMHVRSQMLNIDYDQGLSSEINSYLSPIINNYKDVPGVYLYFHLYNLIVQDRAEFYQMIKDDLVDYQSSFGKKELHTIYDFLRNYCLLKINQGQKEYLKEVFNLYKEQLANELIFDEDGILAEWHYKNIITAGISLEEMDWVELFITDYKKYLHPDLRENASSYNLANFYYAKKEYDKAQDLLIHVEYTDIRYSLNAKMLLLRLYYEKDEYDALQSLLDSFRLYVKRNKEISEERFQGYHNLIKFARRVYNVRNHIGYSDDAKVKRILGRIEEEVNLASVMYYKSWLKSKIKEIKDQIGME